MPDFGDQKVEGWNGSKAKDDFLSLAFEGKELAIILERKARPRRQKRSLAFGSFSRIGRVLPSPTAAITPDMSQQETRSELFSTHAKNHAKNRSFWSLLPASACINGWFARIVPMNERPLESRI